jgi:hypothetical protein
MKLLILILFFPLCAFSTNYYKNLVSNAPMGNNSNAGTTTGASWQTISKVNSFTLSPGDSVLFKGGDTFTGTLTVNQSGTSGSHIVYGSYGTGLPVFSGFTTLSTWTNEGGGIYSATLSASTCNVLTINGTVYGMGRTPNTGYYTYQSSNGVGATASSPGYVRATTITSSNLTGTPSWTGAELVMRKFRYILDRHNITGQSGGTLTFGSLGHLWQQYFL